MTAVFLTGSSWSRCALGGQWKQSEKSVSKSSLPTPGLTVTICRGVVRWQRRVPPAYALTDARTAAMAKLPASRTMVLLPSTAQTAPSNSGRQRRYDAALNPLHAENRPARSSGAASRILPVTRRIASR